MGNEKAKTYASPYELEGRIPFGQAVILGLQHVLAMFVGNLTPLLIIGGMCGLGDAGVLRDVLQSAMLIAGVVSLVQLFTIGPVGARLPIIMGTSSGFIGVSKGICASMGGGVIAYGAILGASLIGGLFEGVLGFFLKPLRRFFPPVVTGTVVMAIGLSLISVGINSFGGGNTNGDFGSPVNLLVGAVVLVSIILLKHFTKGISSAASILFGIIIGYIVCAVLALFLPTTYEYVDAGTQKAVTATCSWVLDWGKVAGADWFALPKLMPVKFVFDVKAVVPILIMFIVTAVETIGDISGITEGGLGREATDKELSGGVICDGLGSSFASFFGVLPNTSFSQNVGLVGMTKIVNLFALSMGAGILVLCGFFPKIAALFEMMPQSVLGGAAVMMFSSIVVSGIQLVTKGGVNNRVVTIVAVALGFGYGLGSTADVLNQLPEWVGYVFGGSGIVPAALVAMVLNIAIPEGKDPFAEENEE
ncbi:uracil-xanthine permease family protein [Extibacter muris]|uniref:uracil-xanthine permease family protein n=1 Tax=Extibacter muris TaxID=1796622 RepID=UPI001D08A714|nr:nucleobase:cation symporter-2 family protein [Extibacter muris]MCB6201688.1 purine permease [Extibacter muris]MCQ4663014.1 purine permease [Extibacter muris]MCQ4693280.1 purine permease [Extibacter muris]